jgi:hypothetical protein
VDRSVVRGDRPPGQLVLRVAVDRLAPAKPLGGPLARATPLGCPVGRSTVPNADRVGRLELQRADRRVERWGPAGHRPASHCSWRGDPLSAVP